MNHEEMMKTFRIFIQEEERRQEFRKMIKPIISNYEYYQLSNMIELEDKTQVVIKQELVEMARKSMDKTFLYQEIEKKEIENIFYIIEDNDFNYELYYLDMYNNILKKITTTYWKPTLEAEKLLDSIIKKAIKYSKEKTLTTLEYIKTYETNWSQFVEKQILFYMLDDKLERKNQKDEIKKI